MLHAEAGAIHAQQHHRRSRRLHPLSNGGQARTEIPLGLLAPDQLRRQVQPPPGRMVGSRRRAQLHHAQAAGAGGADGPAQEPFGQLRGAGRSQGRLQPGLRLPRDGRFGEDDDMNRREQGGSPPGWPPRQYPPGAPPVCRLPQTANSQQGLAGQCAPRCSRPIHFPVPPANPHHAVAGRSREAPPPCLRLVHRHLAGPAGASCC